MLLGMPNSSLRFAVAAQACLLLAAAAACDGGPGPIRSGAELYRLQGCVTCHGANGHGTGMAPDLRGMERHWTREKLVEYLANAPEYIRRDPRLLEQKKRYSLNMPLYSILRPEELQNLADHVLSVR